MAPGLHHASERVCMNDSSGCDRAIEHEQKKKKKKKDCCMVLRHP